MEKLLKRKINQNQENNSRIANYKAQEWACSEQSILLSAPFPFFNKYAVEASQYLF